MSVQLQAICQHIVQANWSDRPQKFWHGKFVIIALKLCRYVLRSRH